jgi:carbamoyl-phosphate synthase small subunit
MKLLLADGTAVTGSAFGADRAVGGEVVFTTGMTGYVEALTDPSYRGQILVMTFPLQGNYGIPSDRHESSRIQVQGLVVSRLAAEPSHHRSTRSLDDWLRSEGVPGIFGVDTRAITRRLRSSGTMKGYLLADDIDRERAEHVDMTQVVRDVAPTEIVEYPGGDLRIVVVDTGAKENIFRCLQDRGATVVRAPAFREWSHLLDGADGVVLTNGPGDPADVPEVVEKVRGVLAAGVPTLGICLGHQLLARAAGASTYKLKFGHRSHNQPVMNTASRRAYVTSQNHGYAVSERTLPQNWEAWYVNLNDGTNEGIRHDHRPFRSVQFHPEAAAGPRDTSFLFDEFLRMAAEAKTVRRR